VLGAQSASVLSITDNDTAGTLQFKLAAVSVSEVGPTATITVTRAGGAASGVTVDYASGGGSATAGQDYGAVSGTLSFGAGVTSRTFPLSIVNDTLDEINEGINFSLTNPQGGALLGAQSASTLTVTDNDVAGTVQFKVAAQSVSEVDSSVTITVTRSGGVASGVTVDYATSDGSASSGSDYTAAAGTLSFGVNELSKTFSIALLNDASAEGNETVNLALSNPGGSVLLGAQPTAVLFLVDDE
jgi:predicted secreted protein